MGAGTTDEKYPLRFIPLRLRGADLWPERPPRGAAFLSTVCYESDTKTGFHIVALNKNAKKLLVLAKKIPIM